MQQPTFQSFSHMTLTRHFTLVLLPSWNTSSRLLTFPSSDFSSTSLAPPSSDCNSPFIQQLTYTVYSWFSLSVSSPFVCPHKQFLPPLQLQPPPTYTKQSHWALESPIYWSSQLYLKLNTTKNQIMIISPNPGTLSGFLISRWPGQLLTMLNRDLGLISDMSLGLAIHMESITRHWLYLLSPQ